MEHKSEGIVLHLLPYTENRHIVRVFCRHFGLKAFMVRSSKSGKGAKTALLQPLTIIGFESSFRENAQIHDLRNLRIEHPYSQIPFDPGKTAMIIFLDELLYKTIPDDYVNDTLYNFLRNALVLLDDALDARNFHIWCMLEICRHYGFYPQAENPGESTCFDLSLGVFTPKTPMHPHYIDGEDALILQSLLDLEWPQVQPVQMHSSRRRALLESLVKYIQLHLENLREIRSIAILNEVFH